MVGGRLFGWVLDGEGGFEGPGTGRGGAWWVRRFEEGCTVEAPAWRRIRSISCSETILMAKFIHSFPTCAKARYLHLHPCTSYLHTPSLSLPT